MTDTICGLPCGARMKRLSASTMLALLSCLAFAACAGRSASTGAGAPGAVKLGKSTYRTIDLEPIANWPLDHLTSPPVGRRTLAGVPFEIRSGQRATFHTQHGLLLANPTEATLSLSGNATAVHILLTGAYVVSVTTPRTVGDITLTFASGAVLTVPIVTWSTIREEWRYTDAAFPDMAPPASPVTWANVHEEGQSRGGRPAVAFLDRLTIQIPQELRAVALSSLRVRDTSQTTAQSADPSIKLTAVTLESD